MSQKYQTIVSPRHYKKLNPSSKENQEEIKNIIKSLPTILGNPENWVLSGGIAIPLTTGQFYREHFDIDIGLHEKYLEEIVDEAKKSNYGLFSRKLMMHTSSKEKFEIYSKVTPEESIKNKNKNLRLIRLDRRLKIVRLVKLEDYFDIYLHKIDRENLISHEDGLIIPTVYNKGEKHYLENRMSIYLRDLRFLQIIKMNHSKDKINKTDLEKINYHFEKHNSLLVS